MPILALAPIILVVAALMALLILYGAQAFGRAVAGILPNWHIPFLGNLRDVAMAGISIAISTIRGWLSSTIAPLSRVFGYPIVLIHNMIDSVVGGLNEALGTAVWITHILVPGVYHTLIRFTRALIGTVQHELASAFRFALHYADSIGVTARLYASRLIHVVQTELTSAFRFALHYADSIGIQTRLFTRSLIGVVQSELTSAFRFALHYADSIGVQAAARALALTRVVQAELTSAFHFALQYADSAAKTAEIEAVKVVNTTVAIADAAVVPRIIDEITALEGVIATDLPAIGSLVRAIPRAIPRDLAASLAMTGALEAVMTRYLRECGVPNCKNLGKFGHDFQAIANAVEAGALLALLVEAAHNPEGAANTVHGLIAGPIHGAASGLRSTVGR